MSPMLQVDHVAHANILTLRRGIHAMTHALIFVLAVQTFARSAAVQRTQPQNTDAYLLDIRHLLTNAQGTTKFKISPETCMNESAHHAYFRRKRKICYDNPFPLGIPHVSRQETLKYSVQEYLGRFSRDPWGVFMDGCILLTSAERR